MSKVVSGEKAVEKIRSGAVIAVNGFFGMYPDAAVAALEKRFLETGEPGELTLWCAGGTGSRGRKVFSDRLSHKGMVKRVVMGHWEASNEFGRMALDEEIEAYNFPMGTISHMIRGAASGSPAIITEIGLKTFVDPRLEGGRLNKRSEESLVELTGIDGREYLLYRTPKFDACFIRGTSADHKGNVTMEKEAALIDALAVAQATKANGGTVIVQVERLTENKANPQDVVIPFIAVDYIVVDPDQNQTWIEKYNPAYTGEIELPKEQVIAHNRKMTEMAAKVAFARDDKHWFIARRAAAELIPGTVINLGMGIPSLISSVCENEGVSGEMTLTVETGVLGGVPASGGSFGASINPDAIIYQSQMFDFYDGGILETTFVGAAEVDSRGNVCVSKVGNRIFGAGGFTNITQKARRVVFMFTFTAGKGLDVKYEGGNLRIAHEGSIRKFKDKLTQVSFSGEVALENAQPVLYITERCVFELREEGLTLIEIAPGIDLEKDILDQMDFKPAVSPELKVMDDIYFRPDRFMNLRDVFAKKGKG